MRLVLERANTSSIFVMPATSSSTLTPQREPTISPWARSHPSAQAFLLTVRRIPAAPDFTISRAKSASRFGMLALGFFDAHGERNAARDDRTNQHRPAEL
jgi:hypothetical protein